MSREVGALLREVGLALVITAAMTAVSAVVAIATDEPHAVVVFASGTVLIGGSGAALVRRFQERQSDRVWPAVAAIAVIWLAFWLVASAVFVALAWADGPLAGSGVAYRDPWNAAFEAISGVTSTGLTMVDGSETDLSRSLQWWRSLLQWVGGAGVALAAAGIGTSSSGLRSLFHSQMRKTDLTGDVTSATRWIAAIYVGLTTAAIVAFLLTEQDAWQAVNHAMTGISTGGFTVTDESFTAFGTGTQLVAMAVILAGSMSFAAHHLLLVHRDPRRWLRLTPLRAQGLIVVGGLAVLVVAARAPVAPGAIVDIAFQWVSAAATAGFYTEPDLSAWSAIALSLLVLAMMIGPPTGSTGGGMKTDRVTWLAKETWSRLRRAVGRPRPMVWNDDELSRDEVEENLGRVTPIVILWLTTWVAGTATLVALTDEPTLRVLFDAASALANAGLDTDVVGPELAAPEKATFVVLMYLGRVELLVTGILAARRYRSR